MVTPGPWHLLAQGKQIQGDGGHEVIAMIGEIPVSICELPIESHNSAEDEHYHMTKEESLDNGRAIAQVPEMVALIQEMAINPDGTPWTDRAQEILFKINGG